MLVTCEHASARIPRPLTTVDEDLGWLETHWAIDLGAAQVAREIIQRSKSMGILARFSRLVCDVNRPPEHPDWIREELEGYPLSFNRTVDAAEHQRREETYWHPYHDSIDRVMTERLALGADVVLLSIHSFTPEFEDVHRSMEIGILYDSHEAVAVRLGKLFEADGFRTALNEPYSGREGMCFAAHRHGETHGVLYLELEVRQDLIDSVPKARLIGRRIADVMMRLGVRERRR